MAVERLDHVVRDVCIRCIDAFVASSSRRLILWLLLLFRSINLGGLGNVVVWIRFPRLWASVRDLVIYPNVRTPSTPTTLRPSAAAKNMVLLLPAAIAAAHGHLAGTTVAMIAADTVIMAAAVEADITQGRAAAAVAEEGTNL
jgi:hypothetical protein